MAENWDFAFSIQKKCLFSYFPSIKIKTYMAARDFRFSCICASNHESKQYKIDFFLQYYTFLEKTISLFLFTKYHVCSGKIKYINFIIRVFVLLGKNKSLLENYKFHNSCSDTTCKNFKSFLD